MGNNSGYAVAVVLAMVFGLGFAIGGLVATQDVVTDSKKPQVTTISSVAETKTEIAYVPKKTVNGKKEKTDLQADIGKTDFTISVNGKEQTFVKSDEEQFVFDKNKLSLDQTSRVNLDINVPMRDETKRWAIGIGASDNGIAYTVDFPIGKSDTYAGWAYKDNDSHAVGVKIKF